MSEARYGRLGPQSAESNLCCCEYVNGHGQTVHMLQLCCECDAFDRLADAALSAAPADARADAFAKAVADIDQRIRFVWPFGGGAAHIGLAGLIAPALLAAAALAAASSFVGLLLAAIALPVAAAIAHRSLLRMRARNGLLLSSTLHAYALFSLHFFIASFPRASDLANAITITFGVMAVLALGAARTQPHAPPSGDSYGLVCARAHRCRVTGAVVARYDHYCAWLDVPVGLGNHRAFLAFVALTAAAAAADGAHAAAGALAACEEPPPTAVGFASALHRCVLWHARRNRGSLDFAVASCMAGTTLAVLLLLVGQCTLISRNLTTYESRHGSRIDYLQTGNPFDRGWRANWAEFLRGECGTAPQTLLTCRPADAELAGDDRRSHDGAALQSSMTAAEGAVGVISSSS